MSFNPGEDPNLTYQPYNILQIGEVTEDTGGGVLAIRTTGGGGGGGDATAANQLTQITAEQATANSVSNIEGMTSDIRTSTINIESSSASIQTTNAANNVLLTDIEVNTRNTNTAVTPLSGILGAINTDTTNSLVTLIAIDADTSLISTNTTSMNTNIAQLKGSLVTMASVNWNSTTAAVIPSARMVVAFINRATGNTVNPYTLSAGAQGHLIASEKLAACQTPNSPAVITYTNCVAIGSSRTYTALEAGILDIDIYYAGAH